MWEFRSSGSARGGARGNSCPYRNCFRAEALSEKQMLPYRKKEHIHPVVAEMYSEVYKRVA